MQCGPTLSRYRAVGANAEPGFRLASEAGGVSREFSGAGLELGNKWAMGRVLSVCDIHGGANQILEKDRCSVQRASSPR